MILRQHLLVSAMAVGLAGGVTQPVSAAPWVRGFVVGAYEYAFRYGGRPDFSRSGEIEPGVDCPHGSSVHFASDEIDWELVVGGPEGSRLLAGPSVTLMEIRE